MKAVEQNTDVLIEKIVYDLYYKKKLSLLQFAYSKISFFMICLGLYLYFTGSLEDPMAIMVFGILYIWLFNKDETLSHEKDFKVWGIIKIEAILLRIEELRTPACQKEGEMLLNEAFMIKNQQKDKKIKKRERKIVSKNSKVIKKKVSSKRKITSVGKEVKKKVLRKDGVKTIKRKVTDD